jgi:hypothetical protein
MNEIGLSHGNICDPSKEKFRLTCKYGKIARNTSEL